MPVPLFLDVSGGELLVVMLFVLLFFGSKGVPDVARTMGRAMRQLRDATADVQREIEKGASDVKKGFEQQRQVFRIEPPAHSAPRKEVASAVPEGSEAAPDAVDATTKSAPEAPADGPLV